MTESTSKIAIELNRLYAAYLQAEKGREPLLTEVGRVANRAFRDDDRAQEFTITTWLSLPLQDLPCTFGGWIFRRLKWRRIDFVRASQHLLDHELQVPEMLDKSGDLLPVDETLDLLLLQAMQDSFTEPIGKLESISDELIRRVAQELLLGYTQDEIALRLGVNPLTLRSRLLRYRRSLRNASLSRHNSDSK